MTMNVTATAATTPALSARTPGAHRAQPDEYVFNLGSVNRIMGGPDYSPVYGGCVEGERMIVAVMTSPAGKSSEPHSHPNEQWIYILQGRMVLVVADKPHEAGVGDVIYIPAGTVHWGGAVGDSDAMFFTVKDASHGLHGIKVAP